MKTRRTQLMLTAGALAMAVALVGCGGGAGPKAAINGGVETQTHTYSASRALTRATQRAAIQSAIKVANAAVRAVTLTSEDADIAAAQAKVTAISAAIAAGTEVPVDEIGDFMAMQTGIQGDLDAREDGVIAYGEKLRLEDELAAEKLEVRRLTTELEAEEAEVARLTGELADANDNIDELQDKLDTANGTIADLEDDLKMANADKDELQGKLDTANDTIADLEKKLKAADGNAKDADQIIGLYATTISAQTDLSSAESKATKAETDATKYAGMLGVLDVGGDSAMAAKNAQMVLDAQANATAAVNLAKTARDEAKAAKALAEALPDDNMHKATLVQELDAVIAGADDKIKAAQAILDGTALRDAVADVTGCPKTAAGCTGNQKPKTAADKGKALAALIDDAFTNATPRLGDPFNASFPTHTPDPTTGKVMAGPSDAQGMSWAQIGGSGLVDKRIAAATGGGTKSVKAKSVAGMKTSSLFTNVPSTIGTADGTQIDDSNAADDPTYKGIRGVLFCAGSDCKVEGTGADQKLAGSWYFTDDDSKRTYTADTATAGNYVLEAVTSYARYGYWLSVNSASDDTTTINRYAVGPPVQSGDVYNVVSTVDAFEETSAEYKGDAVGMSVYKTFDTKGKELSRASGHFDADVSLTMKFGSSPSLEGKISNFRGNAVDSSWSVDLKSTNLNSGEFDNGITGEGDNTGGWTAKAWGGAASNTSATPNPAARPTGVYGGFTADFTNGAAAGAYATRKQ